MKLVFLSIILLTIFIPLKPLKAEPYSCKVSAITVKEKEAVDILQQMYLLQSDMRSKQQNLDEVNHKLMERLERSDVVAVGKYNDLIEKYNSLVQDKNKLSNQHNELKNLYNALLNNISPSRNFAFVNCLNSELVNLSVNTTRLNLDSLNTRIDNLENLQY